MLKNAFAYTDEGGRVLLHAAGDRKEARDHRLRQWPRHRAGRPGPGVRPLPPHRRGRAATDGAALGLGLPLARQFVEAHGGTIELLSEPGEGTTVTLRLPRKR